MGKLLKGTPRKGKIIRLQSCQQFIPQRYQAEKIRLKYADKSAKTTNETPEFIMEETQFKEKLDRALESLPENQRTTFLLNRIDGKKYAEIAEMEGVSVKAIEKRMHLALKTLRDKIDGI